MASLLNNASLLLNPAGSIISYQEDKIYSVLPKNGTGDFTFSGGDGGTRVNQQGYIEQTPANFMLNSGTTWIPYNNTVVVTTGVTDPVGGTRAYNISGIASGNVTEYAYKASNTMSLPAGTTFTYSLYMRGSGTIATYVERSIAGTYWIDYKIHTLSSEWQLFTHSYTVPTDASGVTVYVGNRTGTTATSVDVAFPMLNYGSTSKPYQPTTDRLNYPRITYQNGRGALLQEPQRTNVLTNSQNFNLTPHTLQNATVTTGSGISPDGTNNANKLISSGGSNTFYRWYDNLGALGGTYVYSIFAKADSGSMQYVCIGVNTDASNGNNNVVEYNIANGTVSRNPYGVTAYVEPYKDGWYRLVHIYNLGTAGSFVHPCIAISNGTATLSTFQNLWDSTSGQYVYLWGSQYEAGEFPTTYIPTTSATVTRPLDQFSKNDSPALSSTSWTFYMSGVNIGKNQNSSGNNIDNVNWSFDSGNGPYTGNSLHNYSNNLYYWEQTTPAATNLGAIGTDTKKFAVTKTGNTFKLFRDGVLFQTSTPTLQNNIWDSFRMYGTTDAQGQAFSNNPSTIAIFQTNLSDAQAIELTTVRSGSGGTISYYGPYTIHTFTGSATFTPSFNGQVEVLVVAGGGSGAAGWGNGGGMGGGGAGGLLYASSFGVSQGTGITVTIGAGGAGTTGTTQAGRNGTQRGNPGSNTSFGGLTAIGGGGGAGDGATTTTMRGGSGGGGGYASIGTGGSGISGQGNNGGNHSNSNGFPNNYCGGGGGGAGVVGTPGTTAGGNGGNGLPYSISGFSTYYAGGGGGGTYASSGPGGAGVGGLGGGGKGGLGTTNPGQNGIAGVNFTGGAGGAGGCPGSSGNTGGNGGAGGSGIVIVRYLT